RESLPGARICLWLGLSGEDGAGYPGLPRPAISLRPSSVPAPGANVTIRCEGPRRDVRFFLHKAGDLNLQEHVDPAGDWAEFRIPDVGPQHGGRYSCSYRPRSQFVSSEPSDPVELLVADPSNPPSLCALRSLDLTMQEENLLGGEVAALWVVETSAQPSPAPNTPASENPPSLTNLHTPQYLVSAS
uniref:Ig-like domain-containing protein n=1 Tax=Pelusios castaneus TaxID=367368 RepID=A0A8C8SG25_9SAUR